jgi:hypothetical protein
MSQSPENPPTSGDKYLTPGDVSARWQGRISTRTLSNWRCPSSKTNGPPNFRFGGRILYRLDDLVEWEVRRQNKSGRNRRRAKVDRKVPLNARMPPVYKERESTKRKRAGRTSSDDTGATACGLAVLARLFRVLGTTAAKLVLRSIFKFGGSRRRGG